MEKGDIVSCPTFRRSNPSSSPLLSVPRVLISSPPFVRLAVVPFFRTRTIRGVGYVNPVFIKGSQSLRGLRVFRDFSTAHVRWKRHISKRGKTSRRMHSCQETDSYHSLWHGGRNDVSVFQGWLKPRDNSRGKCSRANFSYILSDMIYFIPGFGEFVEESVYGWFMASEGGISILDCCIRNELSLHSWKIKFVEIRMVFALLKRCWVCIEKV